MKKALVLLAVAAFVALFVTVMAALTSRPLPATSSSYPTLLTIDGTSVHVEDAVTPAQQSLGLGGRSGLAAGSGMLFIFPQDGRYAFWMKDMHFSIDIIWLAGDGAVIYIVPDLSPSTYPRSYGPQALARYVLEVPASFAASHGVKVGDKAQLQ